MAQHSAIKMLYQRVKLILAYLQAVEAGEVKENHEILRAARSLAHHLPVLNSEKFKSEFYNVSSQKFNFHRIIHNISVIVFRSILFFI